MEKVTRHDKEKSIFCCFSDIVGKGSLVIYYPIELHGGTEGKLELPAITC